MKRLISVMLAVLLAVMLLPFSAMSAETAVYGDINGDNVVDMFDYLTIKNIYFENYEPTAEELASADINGDGSVDMFDYLHIKRAYFMNEELKKPENEDWNTEAGNLEYEPHKVEARIDGLASKSYDSNNTDATYSAMVITDMEQLRELDKLNSAVSYGANGERYSDLEYFADNLPEGFFDEKALIAFQVGSPNSTVSHIVSKVSANEEGITMTVLEQQFYGCGLDIYTEYLCMAEVAKADIEGCNKFDVIFEYEYVVGENDNGDPQ